jgi:hypothetical protein
MAKGKAPAFNPGGQKGKLHRELNIPEGQKIPQKRLQAAEKSDKPEVRRNAIRAKTMEGWSHTGTKSAAKEIDRRLDGKRGR